MEKKHNLKWWNSSWSPITGCTPKSAGCRGCYAERMAKRLAGRYGYPKERPFKVTFHPDRLQRPLKWKKPRRIFVCSMGDLFHGACSIGWTDEIFKIIKQCPHHTFMILTKRPQNLKDYYEWTKHGWSDTCWPLKNVWIGITTENQKTADERIPMLFEIPAAVRFVSVEPMLSAIDLKFIWGVCPHCGSWEFYTPRGGQTYCDDCGENIYKVKVGIDWVICGGESGPGARPMHPEWPRSIREQCSAASVPFFFKQWGNWKPLCPYYEEDDDIREDALDHPKLKIITHAGWEWEPEHDGQPNPDCYLMANVGKTKAGRLLDGREWNEYPITQ